MKQADKITVDGVVKLAKEYEDRASRVRVGDPYAAPPSFTEAGARMLCSRKKALILRGLPDDATDEQKAEAVALAPAAARLELDFRWAQWEGKARRAHQEEEHRRQRHIRRQRQAARDREAARAGLTLGQRLDKALAEVSLVATPKAAGLEKPVSGSHEQGIPFVDDPAAKIRSLAGDVVRKVEDELESCRRRRIEREAA